MAKSYFLGKTGELYGAVLECQIQGRTLDHWCRHPATQRTFPQHFTVEKSSEKGADHQASIISAAVDMCCRELHNYRVDCRGAGYRVSAFDCLGR